jgi:diguanylate cyclase (GGDEF)-like protein
MSRLMLVTFVALLTFSAALLGGFIHATNVADEATKANERQLVENHLGVAMRGLLSTEAVQLTWDDALVHAGGQDGPPDIAWADHHIGQFLTGAIDAGALFLVTPDGKLLRAWSNGRPTAGAEWGKIAPAARAALAGMAANRGINGQIARVRPLADTLWPYDAAGRPLGRWQASLVQYRGRAAVMTVISLLPDTDFSLLRRAPNNVVALRYLDAAMLGDLSTALMLPDMRLSAAQPRLAQNDRNALALTGHDGQIIGWMSWRAHRVGPIVRDRTIPLLAAYLAVFIAVLALGQHMVRAALRFARELAASEAQAQHHALHDPMLGLPNRTHVLQRLGTMLAEVVPTDGLADDCENAGAGDETAVGNQAGAGNHADAGANRQTAGDDQVVLAYFDLDHFRAINKTIGHHAGDDLLVQAVGRLRRNMRPGDVLGRLASDEFVMLRHTSGHGRENADALGAEIMAAFAEPFSIFGQSVGVTASCGVSWAPEQAEDARSLLRNADVALFRAKQRGRARYRRFTADMDATIRWRQDMEIELRRAIAFDGLSMVYQPIVNVADGSIASFEALLRWNHRDRGEIGPGVFVPVAEQCGLMPQLGDWVLRRVFADSHDFGAAEISVNLSPLQLVTKDFMASLKSLMREEKVDPTRFTFEITEGVLLDKSERVMGLLNELQDMGFRIALDDFGTGYSSLAYLRAFQFDRIKIDRSFVQGIESDIDAQSILRTIVALGRTLRMKVVAEGVETLLQQQLVHAAGCQLIQGHLYWRALTPAQVIALLDTDRIQSLRMAV